MTSVQTRAADFFKAGGTLHLNAPSYVTRPADDELFQQALAGQFCYVLTSRQRGKSSLMIRTAERLRQAGVRVGIVDLSGLGTQVTRDQWYLGMIRRLAGDLQLAVDPEAWWRARGAIGAVQRFTDFLHDVVLAQVPGRIVIFLDEIDSTLRIDFSDDFFAAIRVMFNLRASSPEYDRLTFVLLGVAAPADLIKDRARTPFNIGVAIDLQEFSRADAHLLEQGLNERFPGRGEAILDRVFYWTCGHPYLTQRLCLEIAESPAGALNDEQIDAIVERLFLAEDARKENNLQYVRSAIEAIKDRRPLMKLYQRVYEGQSVAEDKRDPLQGRLRLVGLVRAEDGVLKVRNEIYRRVFDLPWIRQNTPRSVSKSVIVGAVVTTIVAIVALTAFLIYQTWNNNETTVSENVSDFNDTTDADVRLNALHNLCTMPDVTDTSLGKLLPMTDGRARAWELFIHNLNSKERQDLFVNLTRNYPGSDLSEVVDCLTPSITDYLPGGIDRDKLIGAIRAAICARDRRNDAQLPEQLGGPCV